MTDMNARQPKRAELSARIVRADGTVEELGVVSAWHRNPLIRLWYRLRGIKGRFNRVPAG
jgi:hypothetical protein